MRKILAFCLLCFATTTLAIPLDPWNTWVTDNPYVSRQVPPNAMIARGTGTNNYYVLEVDPTTGEIPVSFTGTFSIDYSGPTGSPVPTDAAYVGGVDNSGKLQGLSVNSSGRLQVDVTSSALPTGASTAAKQPALGTAGTASADVITVQGITSMTPLVVSGTVSASNFPSTVDTNLGSPGASTVRTAAMLGVGSTAVSNTNPVPISDAGGSITVDGTVSASNFPATVATNVGAADSSTLRVSQGSRTYSDSTNYSYAGGNVTTSAWTQLIASTAAAINLLCLTDTSGQVMLLGTGAALSETTVFEIAQGWSGCIPLRIAASTRLSVKAVTATASTGYLTLSGMN